MFKWYSPISTPLDVCLEGEMVLLCFLFLFKETETPALPRRLEGGGGRLLCEVSEGVFTNPSSPQLKASWFDPPSVPRLPPETSC